MKVRHLLLLSLLLMSRGSWTDEDSSIPPPETSGIQRIRIPSRTPGEDLPSERGGEVEEEEVVAFSIAANAQGWVPHDSAGIIRPGTAIRITLLIRGRLEFEPEIQRLNQTGEIGLPLLENMNIGGMDIDEAERIIEREYRTFYRDPLVNIEFAGETGDPSLSPWGFVTMMGNVQVPGPIAIPPTKVLTVSGAIKLAGGVKETGKKGSIRIYRPLPEEESVEVIDVNLENFGRRGKVTEDVNLRAGDVVYIPERIF